MLQLEKQKLPIKTTILIIICSMATLFTGVYNMFLSDKDKLMVKMTMKMARQSLELSFWKVKTAFDKTKSVFDKTAAIFNIIKNTTIKEIKKLNK